MKVLYIAARYHTNQIPIMRGWLQEGHKVKFISQYKGGTEDYTDLVPEILGYTWWFGLLLKIMGKLRKIMGKSPIGYSFQASFGIPPVGKLCRTIRNFKPDIIIMRDRSLYNVIAYGIVGKHGYPCVLYNQTPLLEKEKENLGLVHRLYRKLTPNVRMTPVLGRTGRGMCIRKGAYYVPFVIEPHIPPIKKQYFQAGDIHILCVGKFEQRKHHLMLLDIIRHLRTEYNIKLSLIGEAVTGKHKEYLSRVVQYIAENNMAGYTKVKTNCSVEEVYAEYAVTDLFILPSTGEFASVSQLEAMSCSIPVICSDSNGTSCYIEEGKNGFLFMDKDKKDLETKIRMALNDRVKLKEMGECSFRLVEEKYLFCNYEAAIKKILEDMKE